MSLDAKHYLGTYKTRLEMQNSGISNLTGKIENITKIIIIKLFLLPLDDKIELENEKNESTTQRIAYGG